MSWNALAPWYRWMEYAAFGRGLQRRRLAYLSEATQARRALLLGDGDGRFLEALVRANPHVSVDCVDFSAGMQKLARKRVAGCDRVRFHAADVRTWQSTSRDFDLVVTHFFLDCFSTDEVRSIVARIAAMTTSDARWVVSEFRVSVYTLGLYILFGIWTGLKTRALPDYAAALSDQGFTLVKQQIAEGGWLCSQLWARE